VPWHPRAAPRCVRAPTRRAPPRCSRADTPTRYPGIHAPCTHAPRHPRGVLVPTRLHGALAPTRRPVVSARLRTRTVFSRIRAPIRYYSHIRMRAPPPLCNVLAPALATSTFASPVPQALIITFACTRHTPLWAHLHPPVTHWLISTQAPAYEHTLTGAPVCMKNLTDSLVRTHDGRERALQSYLTCRLIPQPT